MNYYKIVNVQSTPVHLTWIKALLSPADLKAYEAYKETTDYLGIDQEDQALKSSQCEEVKMRTFFANFGKDVSVKMVDAEQMGRRPRYEWQFVIGPNPDALAKCDINTIRKICERYEVPFTTADTGSELTIKLTAKFGPNTRYLSETQWIDSGLKESLEVKDMTLQLKPGETVAKVVSEGVLQATSLTGQEVEELLANGTLEYTISPVTHSAGVAGISTTSAPQTQDWTPLTKEMTKDQLIDILATFEQVNSKTFRLTNDEIRNAIKQHRGEADATK